MKKSLIIVFVIAFLLSVECSASEGLALTTDDMVNELVYLQLSQIGGAGHIPTLRKVDFALKDEEYRDILVEYLEQHIKSTKSTIEIVQNGTVYLKDAYTIAMDYLYLNELGAKTREEVVFPEPNSSSEAPFYKYRFFDIRDAFREGVYKPRQAVYTLMTEAYFKDSAM